MTYLDGLNPQQKEAVLHKEGPLLIVAGAGAGKTKTLTHRMLHLIHEGVSPRSILAITFTNKAAREMQERVERLLQESSGLNLPVSLRERPFVGTFHALGVSIIKENAARIGVPRHFNIFDRNDSTRAMKRAIEAAGYDTKKFEPAKVLSVMSRKKGDAITQDMFAADEHHNYFEQVLAESWAYYERELAREKALDFDDLLLKTAVLLDTDREVRGHYQTLWHYIHIDEYQDTNKVQYEIARLLAARERNICVVGDSDQSIYSWRGADLQNILNFEEDYPDAKVVLLETNYRSSKTILDAANNIIVKNTLRKEKTLVTERESGQGIGLTCAYDEAEEAAFVAARAHELITGGSEPREIAVLYRANFQSRVLEAAMLDAKLPYHVLGTRFFERKEVKDVLAYLRSSLNPAGRSDLERIINVPPRGIGKVTLLKILSGKEDGLPARMREKLHVFRRVQEDIRALIRTEKPADVIRQTISLSGLEQMYAESPLEEDQERLANIRELVTLALRYNELSSEENPEAGIEELLADAALASDQDSLMQNKNALKLMTVHAAKGLEFDHVFITGLEEGLFPHEGMGEESLERSEEERRLFYVALTRARESVHLSCTSARTIFGSRRINMPSQFIGDIDEHLFELEDYTTPRKKIEYLDMDEL